MGPPSSYHTATVDPIGRNRELLFISLSLSLPFLLRQCSDQIVWKHLVSFGIRSVIGLLNNSSACFGSVGPLSANYLQYSWIYVIISAKNISSWYI